MTLHNRLAALEEALKPQQTADPEATNRLFAKLGQMAERNAGLWIDPAHASPAQLLAAGQYGDYLTVLEERGADEAQLSTGRKLVVAWEAQRQGVPIEEVYDAIEREIVARSAAGAQA